MAYKPYIIQMIPRCNVEIIKYLLFFRGGQCCRTGSHFLCCCSDIEKGAFQPRLLVVRRNTHGQPQNSRNSTISTSHKELRGKPYFSLPHNIDSTPSRSGRKATFRHFLSSNDKSIDPAFLIAETAPKSTF